MNVDIQQLLLSLTIGVATALLVLQWLNALARVFPRVAPPPQTGFSIPGVSPATIWLPALLAIGMLVESTTKYITWRFLSPQPDRSGMSLFAADIVGSVLDSDKGYRVRSLLEDVVEFKTTTIDGRINPLLKELQSLYPAVGTNHTNSASLAGSVGTTNTNLSKTAFHSLETLNSLTNKVIASKLVLDTADSVKEFQDAVNALYYVAHNKVYKDPNYFQELREIERRSIFAKSIALLALFALPLYLVLPLAEFLRRRQQPQSQNQPPLLQDTCYSYTTAILIILLLTAPGWCSIEQQNYNRRVFGYYASLVEAGL